MSALLLLKRNGKLKIMRPQILNSLFLPVSSLAGIGPKLTKTITRLLTGNENGDPARVADLIFHAPSGIIDRRNQPGIANAEDGGVATFKVHVDKHFIPPRGNRRIPYKINVHDETGEMSLVFFRGQSDWLSKAMPVGEIRYVSGKVEWFNNKPNMVHPDHMVSEEEFRSLPLVEPVYPTTAGLSSKLLGKSIRTAVETLPDFPEWIDGPLLAREKWPSFRDSVERLHSPRDLLDLEAQSPFRRRLAFDELYAGQLALAMLRARLKKSSGKPRKGDGSLVQRLDAHLPYELTGAQKRSISEIMEDLAIPERMLRLLQGDVGSGKTIVGFIAALSVIEGGEQVAIMAPTEILARQHFDGLKPFCEAIGIRLEILTGKDKAAAKRQTLEQLADGSINLIVGTHALFQDKVEFSKLGLTIIDEQHRFGVHQRLTLGEKGEATDVLVMTATPIPRTLVLTHYGDMDVSRLDEKPPGRQPITTNAINKTRIEDLISRIQTAVASGKKAYWICPLVEESEEVNATAAEDRYADLKSRMGDKVGLVHGRMTGEQKNSAMEAFKTGTTQILVATTVIEVGVDVPDATIMIIEHAERFGLAQLHQLRGRVGRGSGASSCTLLYQAPLSETAEKRLQVMRQTEDGFLIAEEDLKLRGEGEVLGTRQSGIPGFNLAQIEHHSDILQLARDHARLLMETDPQLSGEEGDAVRMLLYLFGQDQAVRLLRAG